MSRLYETILYAVDERVATITLNRPEKRNAYVAQMGEDIVAAFRAAREDESVRAVILTGAGQGFCAGVDLDALKAMQAGMAAGSGPKLGEEPFVRTFPLELLAYPKPVIAAVNGAAIGVGVTMILPCDIRIASDRAKFGVPFTKLGILPGLGSTHLLPRIVGLGRAQELVLTSRAIEAPEALAIGLVSRVVPGEALLAAAREIAALVAACDPDALAVAKGALHAGADLAMADAMENERAANVELRERKAKRAG
ncbi:MAG TPA: enoyl-CoA hydratase-related protein [Myxococcota bacterium]|nr:enoyl-CoA hydratase-related protein [Myxococcota bacterium]